MNLSHTTGMSLNDCAEYVRSQDEADRVTAFSQDAKYDECRERMDADEPDLGVERERNLRVEW